MIEFTTGVVFLMSSLYGAGQTANQISATSTVGTEAVMATSSTLTIEDHNDPIKLQAYLKKEFAGRSILVDIARCESNFHQFDKDGDLIRGMVDKNDVGIMQINERYHDETAKKLGINLHTLEGNVAYAIHLYDEQGVKPWSASSKCWSSKDLAIK